MLQTINVYTIIYLSLAILRFTQKFRNVSLVSFEIVGFEIVVDTTW